MTIYGGVDKASGSAGDVEGKVDLMFTTLAEFQRRTQQDFRHLQDNISSLLGEMECTTCKINDMKVYMTSLGNHQPCATVNDYPSDESAKETSDTMNRKKDAPASKSLRTPLHNDTGKLGFIEDALNCPAAGIHFDESLDFRQSAPPNLGSYSTRPARHAQNLISVPHTPRFTPRPPPTQVGRDSPLESIEETILSSMETESSGKQSGCASSSSFGLFDIVKARTAASRRSMESSSAAVSSMVLPNSPIKRWKYFYEMAMLEFYSRITKLHPVWFELSKNFEAKAQQNRSSRQSQIRAGPQSFAAKSFLNTSWMSMIRSSQISTLLHNQRRACRPISPHGKSRLAWDLLSGILCLFEVVFFPLNVFELTEGLLGGISKTIQIVETLMVFFWTLDMALSFLTGYVTREGFIEFRWHKVVRRYLRTWLLLDFTLVFVDWYLLLNALDESQPLLASLKGARRFLRMLRLMRLLRLLPMLREHMGEINSEQVLTISSLSVSLGLILLLNHYLASSWCYFWEDAHLEESVDMVGRYLTGLHWSLAHSTLGSMDVQPKNRYERIYTCATLVSALVIFTKFLSDITSATTRFSQLFHDKVAKERAIRKYLVEYKIPRELSCRLWSFVHCNHLTAIERIQETEVEVFKLLPVPLREELRYQAFHKHLVLHPLFEWLHDNHEVLVRHLCIDAIYTLAMNPSTSMFWTAKEGVNRMMFVVSGTLEYHPIQEDRIYEIHPGDWTCEEILWCRTAILTGPIMAGCSGAHVVLMIPQEFQNIIRSNQPCRQFVLKYAKLFVQRFNDASLADEDYLDLLFNDPMTLRDIVADAKFDAPSNFEFALVGSNTGVFVGQQ